MNVLCHVCTTFALTHHVECAFAKAYRLTQLTQVAIQPWILPACTLGQAKWPGLCSSRRIDTPANIPLTTSLVPTTSSANKYGRMRARARGRLYNILYSRAPVHCRLPSLLNICLFASVSVQHKSINDSFDAYSCVCYLPA